MKERHFSCTMLVTPIFIACAAEPDCMNVKQTSARPAMSGCINVASSCSVEFIT
jgi:hypothetical protein